MPFRFTMSLVLSIVCLTISACADFEPAANSSTTSKNREDYEAAAKALRKSAEGGNAAAQNRLGLLYNEGQGVPRNYGQAKHWFEKAAEQEHAEAQVNLGMLYLLGQGAPENSVGRQTLLLGVGALGVSLRSSQRHPNRRTK